MKKGALTAAILFVLVAGILGAVLLYSGGSSPTAAQTTDVQNTDEFAVTACDKKTCKYNPLTQTGSGCGENGNQCQCTVTNLKSGGITNPNCIEPVSDKCEGDVCVVPTKLAGQGWYAFGDGKCNDYGGSDATGRTCGCVITKNGVAGVPGSPNIPSSKMVTPCTTPTTTTTTMPTCKSLGGTCEQVLCFDNLLPGKCPDSLVCCSAVSTTSTTQPPSSTSTTETPSSTSTTTPPSTTSTTTTPSTTVTTTPLTTSTT